MKTLDLIEPEISALIDILKDDCEQSNWGDIDFTDADYMEFLAIRANLLKRLQALPQR